MKRIIKREPQLYLLRTSYIEKVDGMKLITAVADVAVLTAPVVLVNGRGADCPITVLPSNEVLLKGKCSLVPEAGGSFTLMDAACRNKFYGTVGMLSIYLTRKDTAEVSGLVLDSGVEHNSRWGLAKHSRVDAACRDDDDFRICAW